MTHIHHREAVFHPLLSVAPLYTADRELEGLPIEHVNDSLLQVSDALFVQKITASLIKKLKDTTDRNRGA